MRIYNGGDECTQLLNDRTQTELCAWSFPPFFRQRRVLLPRPKETIRGHTRSKTIRTFLTETRTYTDDKNNKKIYAYQNTTEQFEMRNDELNSVRFSLSTFRTIAVRPE